MSDLMANSMYLLLITPVESLSAFNSSYLTLIIPYRIFPYTNGRAWARRPGLTRHIGVERMDEFTDEEDGASGP